MQELHKLFLAAVKYSPLKPAEVARQVGISRSALSQYLKGEASLSRDTLTRIAPLVGISPSYVQQQRGNPFEGDTFHKMIIPENIITLALDFSLLHVLMEVSTRLEMLFLSPPLSSYERAVLMPETPIYAIVVRDQDRNIFLFRRRQRTPMLAVIVGEDTLKAKMDEMAREGRDFSHETRSIDEALYQRIKAWVEIQRDDIEPLFQPVTTATEFCELSDEERELISAMREHNISPSRMIICIDNILRERSG